MTATPPLTHIRRSTARAAASLVAIFLAGAVPLIFSGYDQGRAASDEFWFYGATIRQFLTQWPRPNLADYPAATTPGYYLVVAAGGHTLGTSDIRVLRLIGALFTVGLIATLAAAVGRAGAGAGRTFVFCLPIVCSPYIFSGGVYLLPDAAGWWAVLCALLIALRPRTDRWTYAAAGAAMLAVVLFRQSHLWVIAPLCTAAWIDDRDPAPQGDGPRLPARAGRVVLMLAAAVPALLTLAYFVHLWHGMVPPNQQPLVVGGNPAAPAMALATAGVLGAFYAPAALWPTWSASDRRDRAVLRTRWAVAAFAGALIGAVIGALPISVYSKPAGRASGIWNLVRHAPYIANRSPVLVAFAALGGATVCVWLTTLPARQRSIWATAVVAFLAVQVSAHYAFQRYYEPLVLMAAALSLAPTAPEARKKTLIGPLALSVLLAVITVLGLWYAPT